MMEKTPDMKSGESLYQHNFSMVYGKRRQTLTEKGRPNHAKSVKDFHT
jgi:hypothetical protein